jgi:hypothetical protein
LEQFQPGRQEPQVTENQTEASEDSSSDEAKVKLLEQMLSVKEQKEKVLKSSQKPALKDKELAEGASSCLT